MAYRVLNSAEKEQLKANADFINECEWAARNFASHWASDEDIAGKVGSAGYEGWAKNRILSEYILRVGIQDNDLALEFALLAKGMTLTDDAVAPFNIATVIAYMVTNNRFDELASMYMAKRIKEDIRF